jgi:hypothetical protein
MIESKVLYISKWLEERILNALSSKEILKVYDDGYEN